MEADEFKRIITYPFTVYEDLNVGGSVTANLSELHEGLVGFIRAKKIDSREMEVPAQMLYSLYKLTIGNVYGNSETYSEMVVPLVWENTAQKKSADSILQQLFARKSFSGADKILRITTSKRYTYYGGPGIILKEERGVTSPLLLYTFTVQGIHSTECRATTSVVTGPKVIGLNLRVAPSVFENSDIISKCIIKKLIPAILEPLDSERFSLAIFPEKTTMTPKVIVEDLSDWVLHPVKPKMSSFDHDLRQFYADERIINEIIDSL